MRYTFIKVKNSDLYRVELMEMLVTHVPVESPAMVDALLLKAGYVDRETFYEIRQKERAERIEKARAERITNEFSGNELEQLHMENALLKAALAKIKRNGGSGAVIAGGCFRKIAALK